MKEKKRENTKDENIDFGNFFDLASSDKIYVTRLKLHENRSETLLNFAGDFELNASMDNGPVDRRPNNRFRIMDDFESYINARDIDYDSGDVTFTGFVYKFFTPQLNVVKQSAYAKSTNYMK